MCAGCVEVGLWSVLLQTVKEEIVEARCSKNWVSKNRDLSLANSLCLVLFCIILEKLQKQRESVCVW